METAEGATWYIANKGEDGWFGKRKEDNFLQLKSNGTGLPLYLYFYFPPTFWSLIFMQNSLFSFQVIPSFRRLCLCAWTNLIYRHQSKMSSSKKIYL